MYPGGKGSVFQKIINQIPPHETYIETHFGGGAVFFNKKPARLNICIDIDPDVVTAGIAKAADTACSIAGNDDAEVPLNVAMPPGAYFIRSDAVAFLSSYRFTGREFAYNDPPYLIKTRRQQRAYYNYEYTDADHERLLTCLVGLNCMVAISGYWSEMYADMLHGWRVISFEAQTRGGPTATEYLWMNYGEPAALHEYTYLGDNFRERERIKRKAQRWVAGLQRLDRLERQAILTEIKQAGLIEDIAIFGDNGQHRHT